MRFRLLVSEAWRSLGANLSTTVAATMTVLIGMFLLGLFIALGTWTRLVVEPRQAASSSSRSTSSAERDARSRRTTSRDMLQQNQYVKHRDGIKYVSKEQALAKMKKRYPELVKNLTSNPLPDSLEVTPNKAENVDKLYDSIV